MESSNQAEVQNSLEAGLPTWESLVNNYLLVSEARAHIEALQRLKSPKIVKQLRPLMTGLFTLFSGAIRRPNLPDLVNTHWNELVDLASEQVVRNIHHANSNSLTTGMNSSSILNHKFNQLPCSQKNLLERADLIAEYIGCDAPVLLLGDDDLLSLELAKRGFKNVTVVDIDPTIIQRIQHIAAQHDFPIRAKVHDLQMPPSADLIQNYGLIFMDPPCTVAGLKLFVGSALTFCSALRTTKFIACTHSMSLLQPGIEEFRNYLSSVGLRVTAYKPEFAV
ncbi:MAG TPA: bis-aminopropyl spermidine synthase family protein, partial [Oligoflexia bacterium]|nr:bis-aminopropyl spermidine synthase family protein [Oligoflexia bacterium]